MSKAGIGFLGLLTIVLITLKLLGKINLSWWWVWAPIWVPLLFGIVGLIVAIIIIGIVGLCRK